jgi:plastocyanin
MKKLLTLFIIILMTFSSKATIHTITIVGNTFTPDTLVVNVGDTINVVLTGYHDVTEVDQSTWLANGTTYNGGFLLPGGSGGGQFIVNTAQTYYYVCVAHVGLLGMKGIIIANAVAINGCTDVLASNYDSTATIDDGSCTYPLAIGDTYEGGIVFWLDGNGGGFIAAPTDQSTGAEWGCYGTVVSGADGTVIGTGAQNTIDIVNNNCSPNTAGNSIAADICDTLTIGGYSDWFLPSKAELNLMWRNIGQGNVLGLGNVGGFAIDFYWSSTEGNYDYAWRQYFYSGGQYQYAPVKYNTYYVRAVRAFGGISIFGCTDSTATNYNALATIDNSSCIYPCLLDEVSLNLYNSWINGWNGNTLTVDSVDYTFISGSFASFTLCVDLSTCDTAVYNATGFWNSENSWNIVDASGAVIAFGVDNSATFGNCPVLGCTDPLATNYDATANTDDGTCCFISSALSTSVVSPVSTQLSWAAIGTSVNLKLKLTTVSGWNISVIDTLVNYAQPPYNTNTVPGETYSWKIRDNSSLCPIWIDGPDFTAPVGGCTDPLACNYDSLATIDDGSCNTVYGSCYGCTDPLYTEYDVLANTDDGSCTTLVVNGCTDSTAINYNALANTDDGSCNYCTNPSPTNAYVNGLIHNRARVNWDNMNSTSCMVDQYRINYREQGTTTWSSKTMGAPVGSCNFGTQKVDKLILNLNPSTIYEYQMKAWYCGNGVSTWSATQNFTTADNCPDEITVNLYDSFGDGWNGNTLTVDGIDYTNSLAGFESFVVCVDLSTCITALYNNTGSDPQENYWIITDSSGAWLRAGGNIGSGGVFGSCFWGCTDPVAQNYNPLSTTDNGSCNYCSGDPVTGLGVTNVVHDRVTLTFDNMNTYDTSGDQVCRVDQLRIRYREVGTSSWSQKNIASPTGYDATTGICNSTQKTDKPIRNLTLGTTYEWEVKLWYCDAGATPTAWVVGPNFTTLAECPNVGNFTAYGATATKATFDWDDSNGSYEFVRIKMRVDSISNPQGSDFISVGGFGVTYGTFTKDKAGLVPGQTYRAQARTWCDPTGGAYRSATWTPLVFWTQPTSIRLEGGSAINNLAIYPNPSRDIFNISFTSDTKQNLSVRIFNVIGEELINENLEQFIGEYTKQINLSDNAKGIYFLEIEMDDGVINKKLILQ